MQRISSNMDKLLAHMQRDNKFRKANKKTLYPVPRINPRLAPPSSAQEIHSMKDGLKDESKNIVQIAFLPAPEEGASGGPRIVVPGEDIPNTTGRHREEGRRSNLSVNTGLTNNGQTQGTQPCQTDRAADRTVNFQEREQHRTNVISEVQQNLMNISNSQNSPQKNKVVRTRCMSQQRRSSEGLTRKATSELCLIKCIFLCRPRLTQHSYSSCRF